MGGNMLLRNKKTGQEGNFIINKDHFECVDLDCVQFYFSLSELLDEWEDYKPTEPLIKDKKIRKAVRAWAEANEISQAQFHRYISGFSASDDGHNLLSMISFDGFVFMFVDGKYYTIDELCGEEKE